MTGVGSRIPESIDATRKDNTRAEARVLIPPNDPEKRFPSLADQDRPPEHQKGVSQWVNFNPLSGSETAKGFS